MPINSKKFDLTFLMAYSFGVILMKTFPNPRSCRLFFYTFFGSLIVLDFIFKSMINYKLITIYGM